MPKDAMTIGEGFEAKLPEDEEGAVEFMLLIRRPDGSVAAQYGPFRAAGDQTIEIRRARE